jgi:multiple sugar transport system substrate-binding protein
MPSQNLPKPNVPGQSDGQQQTATQKTTSNSIKANSDTTQNSSGQAPSKKATYIFPKTTPGVSSRENPAGRPPAKPTLTPDKPLTEPGLKQDSSSSTLNAQKTTNNMAQAKVAMPKGLEKQAESDKVQMPQPFVPSQIENAAKPVITPSSKPLKTGTALPSERANLTKPSTPPEKNPAPTAVQEPPPLDDMKKNKQAPVKKTKSSLPKILIIFVVLLVVGLLAFVAYKTFFAQDDSPSSAPIENGTPVQPKELINITYWGLWEDGEILADIFKEFENKEGIRVDYRKQSHRDYRERLEQALVSGSGPDLFRYHMTWVPMFADQLAAMPTSIMTSTEYQQTFYPVIYDTLQWDGKIVGIPLMFEGLALLYNEEIFRKANLSVPTTWAEVRDVANQLTVPSNLNTRRDDNITQAGLAIGNASNVDNFADILALLILQNGGNPATPTTQEVEDALTYYTNFMKQDKVWSNNLPNSTMAFARGEVAMIFAPSWRVLDIQEINPAIEFGVAQLPQITSEESITWASFWAEGVNKNSVKQEAAWKLLKYLSSPEVLRKFYNNASLTRAFGEIYPRIDMASELTDEPKVAPFIMDAYDAKAFPLASRTHDNGLNDQLIQYYADAINAVLAGTQPEKALEEINVGINQVLQKYGAK